MLDAVQRGGAGLSAFVPLAVELCDLKRVRDASSPESLATRGFRRVWGALAAGHDPDEVALCSTADALAACRLGGIDRDVLLRALLRTVAYAWQQDAVADNAHEVLKAGKELHSRLETTAKHVTKLGRSLSTATKDFNVFVGSLETRVLPQARRMVDLNVVDESERIGEMRAVEDVPRLVSQPELIAAASDAVVAIDDRASRNDEGDAQLDLEIDGAPRGEVRRRREEAWG